MGMESKKECDRKKWINYESTEKDINITRKYKH